jgi:hypothetical protein
VEEISATVTESDAREIAARLGNANAGPDLLDWAIRNGIWTLENKSVEA